MHSNTSSNDISTVNDCKGDFIAAVHRGMDALMNHCGYSRERASLVLLRELQRTEKGTKTERGTLLSLRPTDDEVR
jgi:hypothetical protein